MKRFQSTRPVRGATSHVRYYKTPQNRFNPRAPCGARRTHRHCSVLLLLFQSTRPVRGATPEHYLALQAECQFQSTRPVRGATHPLLRGIYWGYLFQSTRPVRGATSSIFATVSSPGGFNPRAPCGARRTGLWDPAHYQLVSIHAPRAGRDVITTMILALLCRFQSTRPVRGATHFITHGACGWKRFNPRAPCGARPLKNSNHLKM